MNAIGWTYVNKVFLTSKYYYDLIIIWIPLAIDEVFIINFTTCFLQCVLSSMNVKLKGPTCHTFFALVKWFYIPLQYIM